MQETAVQSLGQEDPLEKDMTTRSSILAWEMLWTEEPAGYSPWGLKESDTSERLHFLFAQMVKNLPPVQETLVQSLCWEDPLEKRMTTRSSILAWEIPWTEEPMGYSPWGHRVGHD